MSTPLPPAGWYPDPTTGHLRWWDGTAWGPYAPPPGGPGAPGHGATPSRAVAIIAHLGFVLGGFIAPLVCYLACDRNDTFTRDHAREALNFQITAMIVLVGGWFVMFVVLVGSASNGMRLVALLVFFAWFAMIIATWVLGIIGAVRASRGEEYRYPMCIRLVRD